MSKRRGVFSILLGGALALSVTACGGSSTGPSPLPTPTPPPGVTIQATGNGTIVIHPSAVAPWMAALELPIRIQETAGGTADWNFARLALFRNGAEIERAEVGSDVIGAAGLSRINPRSDEEYVLLFRINSNDFDDLQLILGFGDVNHGTLFTVEVPFETFTDVAVSFTPLSVPPDGKVELTKR